MLAAASTSHLEVTWSGSSSRARAGREAARPSLRTSIPAGTASQLGGPSVRALFVTCNAPGHLFTMVPLAWAMQAAGHDVRVAGLPSCAKPTSGAGLIPVPVGADPSPQ